MTLVILRWYIWEVWQFLYSKRVLVILHCNTLTNFILSWIISFLFSFSHSYQASIFFQTREDFPFVKSDPYQTCTTLCNFPKLLQREFDLQPTSIRDVPTYSTEEFDHLRHANAWSRTLPPFSIFESIYQLVCELFRCELYTSTPSANDA